MWIGMGLEFFNLATAGPLGLPQLDDVTSAPPAALIALGRQLFFDKRLSANGRVSCATCHQPDRAFSDGRALAQGVNNQLGTRNTPSLLNAAFNSSQFWDGRRTTLEAQASDPLLNPREHGIKNEAALLIWLKRDARYPALFNRAFQSQRLHIQLTHVQRAIAAFERTLLAGDSDFDRYAYRNEKTRLSASAERGLVIFKGPAQCVSCHLIGQTSALFTDNQFHSLRVGLQRIEQKLPLLTQRVVQYRGADGVIDSAILSDADIAELGRFAFTLQPADIGKFRTPSLRNVALTAPYMHDGSVATLEEAVELEIYYRSAESGRPLILTPTEKIDLVEFLKALSSPVTVPHK